MIVSPRDHDCEVLSRFFQHHGSEVRVGWPAGERLDPEISLVFYLVDASTTRFVDSTIEESGATVVGLIDPQNPATLRLLNEVSPHAIMVRPIQHALIAATVVLARNIARQRHRQFAKITRLEEILRAYRKVEQAKAILMERRKIGEPEAYSCLRDEAMRRRVPIGTVASVVVESNEILPNGRK